jgi:hypothetical protein
LLDSENEDTKIFPKCREVIIGGHCVNVLEGLNLVQITWFSVLCTANILIVQFEDAAPDTRVRHWTLISHFILLSSLRLQNLFTQRVEILYVVLRFGETEVTNCLPTPPPSHSALISTITL